MINKIIIAALLTNLVTFFLPFSVIEPFTLIIEFWGYRITTNIFIVSATVLAIILTHRLLKNIYGKALLCSARLIKKDELGLITKFIVSIYNYDHKKANRLLKQMLKIDNVSMKIMVLEYYKKNKLLDKNLKFLENTSLIPLTSIPALELLIQYNIDKKIWEEALPYSLQLWNLHCSRALFSNIIFIFSQLNKWEEALDFLNKNQKAADLNSKSSVILKGTLLYKKALETTDPIIQKSLLLESAKAKILPPYMPLIATYIKNKDIKNAEKFIKLAWKIKPSLEISLLLHELQKVLDPQKFLNICKSTVSCNKDHYESQLLIANAFIADGQIDVAYHKLKEMVKSHNDERVYILLAYCKAVHQAEVKSILLEGYLLNEKKKNHKYLDLKTMEYKEIETQLCIKIT